MNKKSIITARNYSVIIHRSAFGLKIIEELNKKIIKTIQYNVQCAAFDNFLNQFSYNFEQSDHKSSYD